MNARNNSPVHTQLTLPSWPLWLGVGALFVCLAMVIIGWLAWRQESTTAALPLSMLGAGVCVGLGWFVARMPRQIAAMDQKLVIAWLWHSQALQMDQITHVAANPYLVTLKAGAETTRLTYLVPNHAATTMQYLEETIPVAVAARELRLHQALPITLHPRLLAPIVMGGMGGGLLAFGGLLVWYAIEGSLEQGMGDRVGMTLMGLLTGGVGSALVAIVLTSYTWFIHFDTDTIAVRHTFGTDRYDPRYLVQMELLTETRTIKGIEHEVHQLRLHFLNGDQLDVAPNLPSFPTEYASVEEAAQLAELKTILERHYCAVIASELDPATMTDERWGKPLAANLWEIRPYDLAVYRLDYGEHHAAASTVHFLVGHVEAGAMRFRTTNGELCISPHGRYIVLYDSTLLVAFNLDNGRTYHRNSRRGWLYATVQIDGECLQIEEMRRTNSQQREGRKPISLEQPTSALRRGFGSAERGDFPSAYGAGIAHAGHSAPS